jgi:hypothetical protein
MEIERECRGDLDKIERRLGDAVLGIDRRIVIFMAMMAAEKHWDYFSPEIKEAFRDRAMDAEGLVEGIDKQRKKGRAFVGVSEV